MKEITVSRSFSLPITMVQEIEEIAEKGYYNKSEFARTAFQKEIDIYKSKIKNNGNSGAQS